MIDWDKFLKKLRSYPPKVHNLRPPCSLDRVKEAEVHLGKFPDDLSAMLVRFNGGELFIDAMPCLTIFGLSIPTDRPDFDWFIDRYTPAWRSSMKRPSDLVIGMTNFGGVLVLGEDLIVREWDSSQRKWDAAQHSFADWPEKVLTEGDAYLTE